MSDAYNISIANLRMYTPVLLPHGAQNHNVELTCVELDMAVASSCYTKFSNINMWLD
jgi:hypothetical protein